MTTVRILPSRLARTSRPGETDRTTPAAVATGAAGPGEVVNASTSSAARPLAPLMVTTATKPGRTSTIDAGLPSINTRVRALIATTIVLPSSAFRTSLFADTDCTTPRSLVGASLPAGGLLFADDPVGFGEFPAVAAPDPTSAPSASAHPTERPIRRQDVTITQIAGIRYLRVRALQAACKTSPRSPGRMQSLRPSYKRRT